MRSVSRKRGRLTALNLFSNNDLSAVHMALQERREITLVRTLGPVTQRLTTAPAGRPWDVDMVMRFETDDGRVYTSQYFESVAEWKIWT